MSVRESLLSIELLTYGYLREFEKSHTLSNVLPDELKDIMILFHPRNRFNFIENDSTVNTLKIEEDGNKLSYPSGLVSNSRGNCSNW